MTYPQDQEGAAQDKRVREALVQEIRQGLLMFCCPRALAGRCLDVRYAHVRLEARALGVLWLPIDLLGCFTASSLHQGLLHTHVHAQKTAGEIQGNPIRQPLRRTAPVVPCGGRQAKLRGINIYVKYIPFRTRRASRRRKSPSHLDFDMWLQVAKLAGVLRCR